MRACSAATDELLAARKLIAAQDAELAATREALAAQKERARLLAEQNGALQAQVADLQEAATARAAQLQAIEQLAERFRLRVGELEKDLKTARKRTKQAATAAFIGGLLSGVAAGR